MGGVSRKPVFMRVCGQGSAKWFTRWFTKRFTGWFTKWFIAKEKILCYGYDAEKVKGALWENPRGFFYVIRTGQRALSFHRCPFSVEGMERWMLWIVLQ